MNEWINNFSFVVFFYFQIATQLTINILNHTQLALKLFSQYPAAIMRHKAKDGVVYAIWAWFKYNTALSAVV